jgi:acyl-CoA dehydrogenase
MGAGELKEFGSQLEAAVAAARRATHWLLAAGASEPNDVMAASSPYLRLLGTVVCGGLIGRLGLAAAARTSDPSGFFRAKAISAKFFGEQILPAVTGLESAVTAGSQDLFALSPEQLG